MAGPEHNRTVADETSAAHIPLPSGVDRPRKTAGLVFAGFADEYDAARPGYPPAAIERVVAECRLGPASRVLEIGCGTGQATRALAAAGCRVRGLEPGSEMAELARRNLASFPNVEVVVDAFETADEQAGTYDAIVSATAFHWTDPQVSYAKAARLLRPHGHLALLTNAHASGGTQALIDDEVRPVHLRLAPEMGSWTFPSVQAMRDLAGAGGDIAAVWARVDRKLSDPPPVDDLFAPPAVATYPWLASYDRDAYLRMLRTHSPYALMDPGRRTQLMAAVGGIIDERLQGQITKQYVCIVAIAEARRGARAAPGI